jgi:hypothetical protein
MLDFLTYRISEFERLTWGNLATIGLMLAGLSWLARGRQ